MSAVLEIRNLHVRIENKPILKGVNLIVRQGEVHALMGRNGSGKSTLAYALMGHPAYTIDEGEIYFEGKDVLEMEPDERSRAGLFLAFQKPIAVPGVTVANFLRTSINARRKEANPEDKGISIPEFRKLLTGKMQGLKMDPSFAGRYLNDGFSGGEIKRTEILQLAVLEPKIAILDETDSGLDVDALRVVGDGLKSLIGPNLGVMVITHYDQFLNFMRPDSVHVMFDGRIVEEGGYDLAEKIQKGGYDWIAQKHTVTA